MIKTHIESVILRVVLIYSRSHVNDGTCRKTHLKQIALLTQGIKWSSERYGPCSKAGRQGWHWNSGVLVRCSFLDPGAQAFPAVCFGNKQESKFQGHCRAAPPHPPGLLKIKERESKERHSIPLLLPKKLLLG